MKYTKEQRREIYLRCAEEIPNGRYRHICGHLRDYSGLHHLMFKEVNQFFPEFLLFEPYEGAYLWFISEIDRDEQESRINCLLLCAEMTKD